jgi:hypothetical protein
MMRSNRLKTYHFLPWVDGNGITSPRVQKLTGSWQNDGGGDAFVVVPLHPNGTTVLDRDLTRRCELYSPLLVGGRMVQHGVQGFLADSKSLVDYLNRDLIINRVSGEHDFPSGWRGRLQAASVFLATCPKWALGVRANWIEVVDLRLVVSRE